MGMTFRPWAPLLERQGDSLLDFDDLGFIHVDPKVRYGEQAVNHDRAYQPIEHCCGCSRRCATSLCCLNA